MIRRTAPPDADVKDVVNDSRKVTPGALFCACPGERENGAEYIKQAVSNGCAAVVCEKTPAIPCGYITVDNARRAYSKLCAAINGSPQNKLKLAAVTGTNGKTTTTSMIFHILSRIHGDKSAALIGGVKNVVGGISTKAIQTTPDPRELYKMLADAVNSGAGYGVIEASSHALDYEKLAPCTFEVGVMTNLTEDHLDYHGCMENYFRTKCRLVGMCRRFVSNNDDVFTKRVNCPHFSLYDGDYTAKIISLDKNGSVFEYRGEKNAVCRIPVTGRFNVYNALAALCAVELMGEDAGDAAEALSDFEGAPGRFERYKLKNGAEAVIDYAHTPDALENALSAARSICGGRLICVFGCGGDRDRGKRRMMGAVSSANADLTVITSDNSRSERAEDIIKEILHGVDKSSKYTVIQSRRDAILYALGAAGENDVVLLAGKGHEDTETDRYGTRPFSEAEIIKEFNDGGSAYGNNDVKGSGGAL